MTKASEATLPAKLYADAGYDAEWVHDQCRLDWGAESVIKPAKQRADGTRSGFWRSRMSKKHLERKGYGARWAVESLFSALKQTMGSTLTSRKPGQLLAEAAFKVLAYTLRVSQTNAATDVFNRTIHRLNMLSVLPCPVKPSNVPSAISVFDKQTATLGKLEKWLVRIRRLPRSVAKRFYRMRTFPKLYFDKSIRWAIR